MPQTIKELQQLKGVGSVLAKRLSEAGVDSMDKVAQAGEEDLKRILGLNPRAIASILEQARRMSGTAQEQAQHAPQEAVRLKVAAVREKVQSLAETTRSRFNGELTGKFGKKLSVDLVRLVDTLQHIDDRAPRRAKRTARAIDKAQKRIEGLDQASIKKVHKGLKKARRAVSKVLK